MDPKDPDTAREPGSCGSRLALSPEEEAILRRMRQIRLEARHLRAELSGPDLRLTAEQRQRLEARLAELRRQFDEKRQELERANRTKLLRLGHNP